MEGLVQDKDYLKILEDNKGLIYKVANSYCNNEEDSKDLFQEISIQIWKSLHRYDKQYKISTWIYRIALNVAISYYRKIKTRQSQTASLAETSVDIIDYQQDDTSEEIDRLFTFIHELKELDRAVMLLYLENSSYKEIGEILGISETNVATKINRIKIKLKQRFTNHKR